MSKRPASHSGQWYSSGEEELGSELGTWLDMNQHKEDFDPTSINAIIAPHAGYRYSGIVSASSYATVKGTNVKLVVVLGPSHFKYLKNQCAVSNFHSVQTPIGDIEIDIEINENLVNSNENVFKISSHDDDVQEHSLEMQYPLIAKVFDKNQTKILPILVGQFSDTFKRKHAAEILLKCIPNLDSKNVLFVISSDFCHYGNRFNYKPDFKESKLSPNENISNLDHYGFDTLNDSQPITAFTDYLKSTGNTICGKEPILLFLEVLKQTKIEGRWELIDYAQSNLLTSSSDHSVSYLSAIFKCLPQQGPRDRL